MKKIFCLFLVFALLLCPIGVLGEADPAEPLDFGDFTLTLNPRTPGEVNEKADGATLLLIYPLYLEKGDTRSNLNAIWMNQYYTASQLTNQVFLYQMLNTLEDTLVSVYAEANIKLLDLELLESGFMQLDGMNALYYQYYNTLDYSDFSKETQGLVMSLYFKGIMVSGDFGTYTFTYTSEDPDTMATCFDPLMATLRWN